MQSKKIGLTNEKFSYCPGCLHGVVHKLIAEVLEEMDEVDNTIGIAPVGCAVMAYKFFNCDMQEAAHGRACAVATGIKRVRPHNTVFTYQGDGDLSSIGIAETIHAANRGENITVIFVNNANFGMTGGQMSPCTLLHQKTTTSPDGRDSLIHGNPMKVSEMISQLDGPALVTRTSVTNPKNVMQTKMLIKKAFNYQKANKGFSIIEVLSTCPINWGKKPLESIK
jgi:2-oxoglutarate ferredoxin oxidoreductase subunit beta